MYTVEEKRLMNLGDNYTLMYGYIVQEIRTHFGEQGERAVREGTRRYGRDRARTTRQRHLDVNAKINLQHLFSLYFDLPNDPRFRREKQELNPQERVSHTLVCPMADLWKVHGQMDIGRIYCEEFHPACYSEYAYGYSKVNLAKTLTQAGDEYCSFNVVLRPANLPDDLKKLCFEEYDPDYVKPEFPERPVSGKDGFHQLSIKLYYYLLEATVEALGTPAIEAISLGVRDFAGEAAKLLLNTAEEYGLPIDGELILENLPISLDYENHAEEWEHYRAYHAQEIWRENFNPIFYQKLGMEQTK